MTKQELFKPEYSDAEVAELAKWFETRADRLPQTLQIDDATRSDDLPRTVKAYIKLLTSVNRKISHSGYMAHLLLIRERLREEGLE